MRSIPARQCGRRTQSSKWTTGCTPSTRPYRNSCGEVTPAPPDKELEQQPEKPPVPQGTSTNYFANELFTGQFIIVDEQEFFFSAVDTERLIEEHHLAQD